MTQNEKLDRLKRILGESSTKYDAILMDYLVMAKEGILEWYYANYEDIPEGVNDIPVKFQSVQIWAVVAGFNLRGAENQSVHNENGISRSFNASDMLQYIRKNIDPLIR